MPAPARPGARQPAARSHLSRRKVAWSVAILLALVFSKSFYTASLNSFYTFYLISRFQVSVETAQIYLFAFLASVAAGTLIGGPVGDRIGRKRVLWISIVGVLPFALVLPYVDLFWTGILTVVIGLILASASSAIIVYALELVPGKVGTVAGLFFGLSFGMAGIGAVALGRLADATSIDFVYQVCAFLPLLGLLTVFLPDLGREQRTRLASPVTGSDRDARCRREPVAASICAFARPHVEPVAVPRAAQDAVLRHRLVERPEPMRTDRGMGDEQPVLALDNAERRAVELDEERQPAPQLG